MRIRSFHMDGFGIFSGQQTDGLSEGINLFLGSNEAGKSTTLGFFRTMLFGYPVKNNKAEPAYPPLRGGAPGGGLLLETRTMGTLRLQRRPGTHGGPVTLTTADGKTLQPDLLDKLLGGVTRELFRTVYGFSLSELQDLASLDGEKVRHVLHSASFGAGSRPVGEVLKECARGMDELFKPRAQKPAINTLLRELGEVRGELRTLSAAAARYDETQIHAEKLEQQLESLRSQTENTGANLHLCRRTLALWEHWTQLQQAEALLAAAGPRIETFPADGTARLDALIRELEERTERVRTADRQLQLANEACAETEPDTAILENASGIQALVEKKTAYIEAERGLAALRAETQDSADELKRLLATLGPAWTPERVAAFDLSLFTRERIDRFDSALADARDRQRDAEREAERAREAMEDADRQQREAAAALAALPQALPEAPQAVVSRLITGRDRAEAMLRELPLTREAAGTEAKRLQTAVADISPRWTPDLLQQFDTSLPARQHAATLAAQVLQSENDQDQARRQQEDAAKQAARMRRRYEEQTAVLDRLPAHATAEGLAARRSVLRRLRDTLHRQELAAQRCDTLEEKQAALPGLRPVPVGSGALAMAAAAALPLLWHTAPQVLQSVLPAAADGPILYIFSALLAVCGGCLFISGRSRRSPDMALRLAEAQAEAADIARQVLALAAELDLPDTARETLDEAENGLEQLRAQVEERAARQREADTARQELKEAEALARQADTALAQAQERCTGSIAAWHGFLEEHQLPSTLLPQAADDLFRRVDAARGIAGRLHELEQTAGRTAHDLEEYLEAAGRLDGLAGLHGAPDTMTRIDRWIEENSRQQELRRRTAEARHMLEERTLRSSAAGENHAKAVRQHEAAYTALQEVTAGWKAWLEERGLDTAIMPAGARRALDTITECTRQLRTQDSLRRRRQNLEEQVQSVHQALDTICQATARTWHRGEAPAAINMLAAALDQARAASARRSELQRTLPGLQQEAQTAALQLKEARQRMAALLHTAQAGDEETFRSRAQTFEEQERLRRTINDLNAQLQAATADVRHADVAALLPAPAAAETSAATAGEHSPADTPQEQDASVRTTQQDSDPDRASSASPDADALRVLFASVTRDTLEARAQRLEQELATLREQQEQVHTDLHEARAALRTMQTSDHTATLLTTRESKAEELRRHAQQWAVLALARHFVEQAKATFERERQPEVVKAAAAFLQTITDGAYTHIQTSLEDSSIRAVTAGGDVRLPEELSRGTAEQLYLALRLGYISSHAAHGEPLPVIMDDILVNFDPHRAACTARAFVQLAQHNQVLFFTCHPQTAVMMRAQAAQSALFSVENGTIRAQDTV